MPHSGDRYQPVTVIYSCAEEKPPIPVGVIPITPFESYTRHPSLDSHEPFRPICSVFSLTRPPLKLFFSAALQWASKFEFDPFRVRKIEIVEIRIYCRSIGGVDDCFLLGVMMKRLRRCWKNKLTYIWFVFTRIFRYWKFFVWVAIVRFYDLGKSNENWNDFFYYCNMLYDFKFMLWLVDFVLLTIFYLLPGFPYDRIYMRNI